MHIDVAAKLKRKWPAALWEAQQLEPVEAQPVPVPEPASDYIQKRMLHTNDEALVENKAVASLADHSDMTPEL